MMPGSRERAPRADRQAGNRAEYERNKAIIFKTQTVCGICGKPVDFSLKPPHPLSASCDHIIPLTRGGHPTDINNLQLAHRICNMQKKNKILVAEVKDERQKIINNRDLPQHEDWFK